MTTTTLTREKFTDRGDQCWAVKNELHSAGRRGAGWCHEDCDLLPGGKCWADCSFVGARDLYQAWTDENRDDEVIWGALEDWHATHFQVAAPEIAGEQR